MTAIEYPFLLDYKRQVIVGIDIPGEASLDPGMPHFCGFEVLKKYLIGQGIHFIAHVPLDRSTFLHNRTEQKANLVRPTPVYGELAWYEIDFFDNIDQIAKTEQILYDSSTIRVIALKDEVP